MATMMDLDKDREVVKRTIKEKGPLTKAVEDFRSRKGAMSRQQSEEGVTSRMGGMGSMKNVDAGTGRGTTAFGGDKTFKQAFAEARKSGQGQFTWNGKKYTTELAKPKKTDAEEMGEMKPDSELEEAHFEAVGYKKGGSVKMGGTASSRADGCAQRGKTKGKVV